MPPSPRQYPGPEESIFWLSAFKSKYREHVLTFWSSILYLVTWNPWILCHLPKLQLPLLQHNILWGKEITLFSLSNKTTVARRFLLCNRIAGVWLRKRPNGIGKGSTLLDKGSAEAQAARWHHTVQKGCYVEMVLPLTTQIMTPYCASKQKQSNLV